ncbi:MAG: hypothetical protein CML71_03535 [Rhodobacterales bacterium]|nr:hypothetical protein [Rhodobacterales bacterium]|tara:strand:+ start:94 stop:339 length:246 start_codon:yes stop_codon:yes gene_type:complete
MVRLIFLIAAIFLAVLLFWGISFLPKKKLNLDLFCLVNVLLYFALLGSTYIFIAGEELGLLSGIVIIGVVGLRKYLSERWI